MLYSAHQPDLLPYSGFWFKMAHADVFDLKVWDQYVNRGYQRRVNMRGRWANIPLEPGSSTDSIFEKLVKPEAASVLAASGFTSLSKIESVEEPGSSGMLAQRPRMFTRRW